VEHNFLGSTQEVFVYLQIIFDHRYLEKFFYSIPAIIASVALRPSLRNTTTSTTTIQPQLSPDTKYLKLNYLNVRMAHLHSVAEREGGEAENRHLTVALHPPPVDKLISLGYGPTSTSISSSHHRLNMT
tara:strand:- start:4538 stop:4924 length:387 start_codon:yes stop_codon:yes gene_type:complete